MCAIPAGTPTGPFPGTPVATGRPTITIVRRLAMHRPLPVLPLLLAPACWCRLPVPRHLPRVWLLLPRTVGFIQLRRHLWNVASWAASQPQPRTRLLLQGLLRHSRFSQKGFLPVMWTMMMIGAGIPAPGVRPRGLPGLVPPRPPNPGLWAVARLKTPFLLLYSTDPQGCLAAGAARPCLT